MYDSLSYRLEISHSVTLLEIIFKRLLHVTDWLPTLYSAAGGDAAADLPADTDGIDQWANLVEAREPSARQGGGGSQRHLQMALKRSS